MHVIRMHLLHGNLVRLGIQTISGSYCINLRVTRDPHREKRQINYDRLHFCIDTFRFLKLVLFNNIMNTTLPIIHSTYTTNTK